MPVPFPSRWPAAVAGLALAVGLAAAQPPPRPAAQPPALGDSLDRLLDHKPAAAADGDGPLARLQKERFNTRLKLVQAQVQLYRTGALSVPELVDGVNRLAQSGIELEAAPAGRIKWHELRVDLLRHHEQQAEQAVRAGTTNQISLLTARAARLEAEIELQKAKDAGAGGK